MGPGHGAVFQMGRIKGHPVLSSAALAQDAWKASAGFSPARASFRLSCGKLGTMQLPTLTCVCVFFLLPIQRVTFNYDGSTIVPGEQGAEYQDFIQQCTGRRRAFWGELLIFWEIYPCLGRRGRGQTGRSLWPLRVPPGAGGTRFERFRTS